VLAYLGFLREENIKEKSLNPYVSAINQAHADLGLRKPAIGDRVRLLRKGYGEENGLSVKPVLGCPVPAKAIYDIALAGIEAENLEVLRDCAAVVLAFCFMHRGDTGEALHREDIQIEERGIGINPRSKTLARNEANPSMRLHSDKFDPGRVVYRLLSRWRDRSAYYQQQDSLFWALPQDNATGFKFPSSSVDAWLRKCLVLTGWVAPPGQKWTGHSLRKGGASTASAIGVSQHYILLFGQWKSLVSLQRYVGFLVVADQAAFIFFGWMLPVRFEDCTPLSVPCS